MPGFHLAHGPLSFLLEVYQKKASVAEGPAGYKAGLLEYEIRGEGS